MQSVVDLDDNDESLVCDGPKDLLVSNRLILIDSTHLGQDGGDVDGSRTLAIFSIDNWRAAGIGEPVSPFAAQTADRLFVIFNFRRTFSGFLNFVLLLNNNVDDVIPVLDFSSGQVDEGGWSCGLSQVEEIEAVQFEMLLLLLLLLL